MILFEKVRWKNFLSTGNQFTEIDFLKHSTNLIIGTNGAGKSTVLDALTFSLFGKAFRKINKPQLINSVNEKDCVVEVEFSISGTQWKIERGIKPAIFKIWRDDNLLDQSAAANDQQKWLEQNVLKMNYKSFTQIVILGSSTFVPFMQLTPSNRREVIEDLLDIRIFSSMDSLSSIFFFPRFSNSSIKFSCILTLSMRDSFLSSNTLTSSFTKRILSLITEFILEKIRMSRGSSITSLR